MFILASCCEFGITFWMLCWPAHYISLWGNNKPLGSRYPVWAAKAVADLHRQSPSHYSWMETNAPFYYSEAVAAMGPILHVTWEKSRTAAVFVTEFCSDLVLWFRENGPHIVEWVNGTAHWHIGEWDTDSQARTVILSFPLTAQRQHPRRCFPVYWVSEGTSTLRPCELRPSSHDASQSSTRTLLAEVCRLLQVSTYLVAACITWRIYVLYVFLLRIAFLFSSISQWLHASLVCLHCIWSLYLS